MAAEGSSGKIPEPKMSLNAMPSQMIPPVSSQTSGTSQIPQVNQNPRDSQASQGSQIPQVNQNPRDSQASRGSQIPRGDSQTPRGSQIPAQPQDSQSKIPPGQPQDSKSKIPPGQPQNSQSKIPPGQPQNSQSKIPPPGSQPTIGATKDNRQGSQPKDKAAGKASAGENQGQRASLVAGAALELAILGGDGFKALKANLAKKKLTAFYAGFQGVALLMWLTDLIFTGAKGTFPTVFSSISTSNFYVALYFFMGVNIHGFIILACNISGLLNGILFMFLVMIVTNLALTSASRAVYSITQDTNVEHVIDYINVQKVVVEQDPSLKKKAERLFTFLVEDIYKHNPVLCERFGFLATDFSFKEDPSLGELPLLRQWQDALNDYEIVCPDRNVAAKCCVKQLFGRIKNRMIFNVFCSVCIIIMIFILAAIFWHYYAELKAVELVDLGTPPDFDLLNLQLPTFGEVDEVKEAREKANAKRPKRETKRKHHNKRAVQERLRKQSLAEEKAGRGHDGHRDKDKKEETKPSGRHHHK